MERYWQKECSEKISQVSTGNKAKHQQRPPWHSQAIWVWRHEEAKAHFKRQFDGNKMSFAQSQNEYT